MTKRIERRNDNIRAMRKRGMTFRAIARVVHLTHTQVANICKEHATAGKPGRGQVGASSKINRQGAPA